MPDPVPNRLTLTSVVVPSCRSRTNKSKVLPLVSFATKSLATLWNATKRPSALIAETNEPAITGSRSRPVDAHQRSRPQLQIPHEHVAGTVGIVRHQVGRKAAECDETAVGLIAETNEDLLPDPVPNRLTLTNVVVPSCRSRTNTSFGTVGIVRHQIARNAAERHVPAVGADHRLINEIRERPLPDPVPNRLTLTNVVVPSCKSRTNMSPVPLVSFATKSLASLPNATKRPSALITSCHERPLPDPVPNRLMLTNRVTTPDTSTKN